MSLTDLRKKIDNRTAKLTVIGLGYVGLPLAATLADCGFHVLGVDVKAWRVETVNKGENPIGGEEPGLNELINKNVASGSLQATGDYADLHDRDVVFVNVETPVGDDHKPDYRALISALYSLGKVIPKGALVIIESTISPGTMQQIVLPILEEESGGKLNVDFYLGNCPERVMPGKLLANIRNMSRVVGGANAETAAVMAELYRLFVKAEIDPTDWITAELVKTVENTYRDVQIAFANEIAMLCEQLGADVWHVRELVNKTPHRDIHFPGAGVGGHCIPKDPWLLTSSIPDDQFLKLIPTARHINDGMPAHMASLLEQGLKRMGKNLAQSNILILGYAYLEGSDDERNSPSASLVQMLQDRCASLRVHDPYIPAYQGNLYELAKGCDALVIMTAHKEYFSLEITKLLGRMRSLLIVDGRNVIREDEAHGFTLIQLGKGSVV